MQRNADIVKKDAEIKLLEDELAAPPSTTDVEKVEVDEIPLTPICLYSIDLCDDRVFKMI